MITWFFFPLPNSLAPLLVSVVSRRRHLESWTPWLAVIYLRCSYLLKLTSCSADFHRDSALGFWILDFVSRFVLLSSCLGVTIQELIVLINYLVKRGRGGFSMIPRRTIRLTMIRMIPPQTILMQVRKMRQMPPFPVFVEKVEMVLCKLNLLQIFLYRLPLLF